MNNVLSLHEFKARAIFYPKGRVIPNYILKITGSNGRRHKRRHIVVFGSDSWVLPMLGQHVILCDTAKGGSAIRIKSTFKSLRIDGSPSVQWKGTTGLDADEVLSSVQRALTQAGATYL